MAITMRNGLNAKSDKDPSPIRIEFLSKPEKAAIVIASLGRENAEPLLKQLDDDEMRYFARASARLGEVPQQVMEAVVVEFLEELERIRLSMTPDRLKELLSTVLNDDAIERILEDMDESEGRSIWEKLSNSDPIDLSNYLAREHPQTVAVVLSRMRPEAAARVMSRLETEFAEDVVMRISNISQLSATVLDAVKRSIEDEFLRNARLKKSKRKPDELVGAIFNFMPTDKRGELMTSMEEKAPVFAAAVQRKMFTFADIPKRVERTQIVQIMREIDNDVLITALSHSREALPEAAEFFLANMSRRLSEQLSEMIEERKKPTTREGEDAQFQVVETIKKMADGGRIKLISQEEDDAPAQD